MKKILLLVLFCVAVSKDIKSQITKGNWMVGGLINYSRTNYNSENYGPTHIFYNVQIKPNVGYFITDKLASGLKIGFSKTGDNVGGTSGYLTYTDFNIGPFIRYYFLKKDNLINVLTEGSYQYGFEHGNSGGPNKNSIALSAGPVVYFNSSVGLEFLITYSTYKFSSISGSNNTILFGFGLQIHLETDK